MTQMITNVNGRISDETAIRNIAKGIEAAWNAGDGYAFAESFIDDADYTVWNGHFIKGKQAVAEGHHHLFNNRYKDTQQQIEVVWIRFLRDDVAVAQLTGGIVNSEELGVPKVKPLLVLVRENGRWQIAVLQNTPILPFPDSQ